MNLSSLTGPEEPTHHVEKPPRMPTKAMLTYLITRTLMRVGRIKR